MEKRCKNCLWLSETKIKVCCHNESQHRGEFVDILKTVCDKWRMNPMHLDIRRFKRR